MDAALYWKDIGEPAFVLRLPHYTDHISLPVFNEGIYYFKFVEERDDTRVFVWDGVPAEALPAL